MKVVVRNLFAIASLGLLCNVFVSCSSESLPTGVDSKAFVRDGKMDDSKLRFLCSVDSLNEKYSCCQPITRSSGGFWGGKAADFAGYVAGGYLGKYAGCSLGTMTGNPVIGIAGYVAGRKYGGALCSVLASYIYERINNGYMVSVDPFDCNIVQGIAEPLQLQDSIGVIHNSIMFSLSNNNLNYDLSLGQDYDRIYEDCVGLLRIQGYVDDSISQNTVVKNKILEFVKRTAEYLQVKKETPKSYNDMLEYEGELVKSLCDVSDEDVCFMKEYGKRVLETSEYMNTKAINEYADELSSVIQNSTLSDEEKKQAADDANIILSSSICWQKK